MTTALVLSGGAATGCFEIGVLEYLYENGFVATVMCSTSVGSVNAIQLAHGGSAASQKAAFDKLKTIWQTELTFNEDMYVEAAWLRAVTPRTRAIITDLFAGNIDVPSLVSQTIFFPPFAVGQAVVLGLNLNEGFNGLKGASSLFTLDPTRAKLDKYLDRATVANSGVELRLVAVSLDSGAVRYITQDGRVLETDGRPVPGVNSTMCAAEQIAYDDAENDVRLAKTQPQENLNLAQAQKTLVEASERLNQCKAAAEAAGIAHNLVVDVADGVIASSAIPCAFPPVVLGDEAYVDGGVRWQLPLKAALDFDTDSIVAINTSPICVPPATRDYRNANLLDIAERAVLGLELWETLERHLELVKVQALQRQRKVWLVAPRVVVHDGLTVDPGLIDINIGYGWMCAADLMTDFTFAPVEPTVDMKPVPRPTLPPVNLGPADSLPTLATGDPTSLEVLSTPPTEGQLAASPEGQFVDQAKDPVLTALADAIAKCRRRCWELEYEVFGMGPLGKPLSPHSELHNLASPEALDQVRLLKSVLGLLVLARRNANGRLPSDATTWADNWERHQWAPRDVPGPGDTPWHAFISGADNRDADTRPTSMIGKAPDKPEVFLITAEKHWIRTPAALLKITPLGFTAVKEIPADYLDAFPLGNDIDEEDFVLPGWQADWRWCSKCYGLFFGGNPGQLGHCPVGGTHAPPEESGSWNYSLPHDKPIDDHNQADWRWCNKCYGLFFGGGIGQSRCPAGGTHAPPEQSGSGNYTLPHEKPTDDHNQADWRWCNKCQSLFFGGNPGQFGHCPVGGTHAPPEESGSWNYSLPYVAS